MLILSPTNSNIQKARRIVRQGGAIIYPTDTLYGLGVDIFNQKAIKKIIGLKGRSFNKPISVAVSDLRQIRQLAYLNQRQEKFIRALFPGPFTIILKKKRGVNGVLTAGRNRIGIRIPDSEICQKLSRDLPITSTSANISGIKPTCDFRKLIKIFNGRVDLILKGRKLRGRPSIVIDLTKEPFRILRG